jgi:hypothetical protein
MALTPAQLRHGLWLTLPAALYFVMTGFEAWREGDAWKAAATFAVAGVVAAGPLATGWRVLSRRHSIALILPLLGGVVGFVMGGTPIVRVAGFVLILGVQLAGIVLARRSGTAFPEPDDTFVVLDINRAG